VSAGRHKLRPAQLRARLSWLGKLDTTGMSAKQRARLRQLKHRARLALEMSKET